MKIALIQQHATENKAENVARGLAAIETAARNGAKLACFAELAFEWSTRSGLPSLTSVILPKGSTDLR